MHISGTVITGHGKCNQFQKISPFRTAPLRRVIVPDKYEQNMNKNFRLGKTLSKAFETVIMGNQKRETVVDRRETCYNKPYNGR